MRILIVYNTATEPYSISGVLRHFAGVVNHWAAEGHEVDFLVARAAWPLYAQYFPKARLLSSDNWHGVPRHLHQTWRNFSAYGWRIISCLWQRLPVKYDVVYACSNPIFEVFPALQCARRSRAVAAVKIHHLVSAQPTRTGFFDRLFRLSERISTRWLHRYFDVIICSTPPVAADFERLQRAVGLVPRVPEVIGYGIDLEAIPYSADLPKSFDAVLLGRIHEHKGVFDAPTIWAAVCKDRPDARLLIIGEGPHRQPLRERFAELGLTARVTFAGSVDDQQKNRLLAQARVGLSLSREEGWGLSITEFMAAGMPVVAMHLPVFDHVFGEELDYVPLADTGRAAERILHWLANPEAAQATGRRGRDYVARFDYRGIARTELATLAAAVQRRGNKDSARSE